MQQQNKGALLACCLQLWHPHWNQDYLLWSVQRPLCQTQQLQELGSGMRILYTLMHQVYSGLGLLTTQQLDWISFIALSVGRITLLHASCRGRINSAQGKCIERCWSTFAQGRFSSASAAVTSVHASMWAQFHQPHASPASISAAHADIS